MNEEIVVINKNKLFCNECSYFEGINPDKDIRDIIIENFNKSREVMVRDKAECDLRYKQPISYVIVRKGDYIYVSERLRAGGEKRLHDSVSIGFGGHMNDIGKNFNEILIKNIEKELEEELYLDNIDTLNLTYLGIVNDDKEEVSKYHLGFGYILNLKENEDVSVKETHKLRGFWINIEELKTNPDDFKVEGWGKLFLEKL